MTDHPCKGLSRAAIEAFEAIATGQQPFWHPRTIEALTKRGLIEQVGKRELGRDRFGSIEVPIYDVPFPVHMQWCRWASENVSDDELNAALDEGQTNGETT